MAIPPRRVVLVSNALQRWLRRVADSPMPPEARLLELASGVATTQVLATVADLDIAGFLGDRTMSSVHIAALAGTDPDATHRLLRAASALGVCSMHPRTDDVTMTRVGKALRRDRPDSAHD